MKNKILHYLKKRQLFWDGLYYIGYLIPLFLFKKLPKSIKFESTNICNLQCPVCPTPNGMKRVKGFLDFDLYKNVLDEFIPYKQKPKITFSMSGEPMLNKKMPEFIEYANRNGHKTSISTNVTNLDEAMSEALIKAGLTSIRLAIDGITKESHEAYRVGSEFNKVRENIENFLLIKKKLKAKKPEVLIQTLLTSYSENEIEEIKKWSERIGADGVIFKSFSMGSYTSKEIKNKYSYLLPISGKYLRKKTSIKRTICKLPINETVIFWNGDLGLCCIDFNGELNMPNVRNGFIKNWESKKVMSLRKRGFLRRTGICQNCSLGNADYGGFIVKF